MKAPRRIRTLDHGMVTIVCPDWCLSDHKDGLHRVDISHVGPDEALTLPTRRGPVTSLTTALEVRPYATEPFCRTVFVNVEIDGNWYPTGLAGLEAMADALAEQAEQLRDRARTLAALLREGRR